MKDHYPRNQKNEQVSVKEKDHEHLKTNYAEREKFVIKYILILTMIEF